MRKPRLILGLAILVIVVVCAALGILSPFSRERTVIDGAKAESRYSERIQKYAESSKADKADR